MTSSLLTGSLILSFLASGSPSARAACDSRVRARVSLCVFWCFGVLVRGVYSQWDARMQMR